MQVLLLCGPPGLGKTTLAHVAAKHCGYHVVEVGFPTWDTSLAFHETGQYLLYCSKGNNGYFLSEFSDIWVSMWSQINASDDRVATTLQAKILDAIQMKSVTGDKRPNCLVSTLQQDLSLMTPDEKRTDFLSVDCLFAFKKIWMVFVAWHPGYWWDWWNHGRNRRERSCWCSCRNGRTENPSLQISQMHWLR